MIDPRKSGSFASHGEKEHDVVCGEQGKRGFGGLEQRHSERRVEMKRVASDFWSFGYRYAWVKKRRDARWRARRETAVRAATPEYFSADIPCQLQSHLAA